MAAANHFVFDDQELSFTGGGVKIGIESSWQCQPPLSSEERWPPLGAAASDTHTCTGGFDEGRVKGVPMNDLEDKHEKLNASLMALTSHFAQVQFRLKQIVTAPKPAQENLLRELEDFAFQACPNVVGPDDKTVSCPSCTTHQAFETYENRLSAEDEKQKMLVDQLKMLLDILEQHASKQKNATGRDDHDAPDGIDSKQCLALDQLRTKLNLSPDEMQNMRPEDLKNEIDKAMARLTDPAKAKEEIIHELQSQIQDMEQFVHYLADDDKTDKASPSQPKAQDDRKETQSTAKKASHNHAAPPRMTSQNSWTPFAIPSPHIASLKLSDQHKKRIQDASIAIIKRALAVLQIFAISQFGCSAKHFEEHMMRKAAAAASSTTGFQLPLRNLKGSIETIRGLHLKLVEIDGLHPGSDDDDVPPPVSPSGRKHWTRPRVTSVSSQSSRSRSSSMLSLCSDAYNDPAKRLELSLQEDLIRLVRGDLSIALKELLQHGLCKTVDSRILTPQALIGCMSSRSRYQGAMHAWELLNEFYQLKQGKRFNMQPSVLLSESFGVDLGGTLQTPKESLLAVIHRIKTSHEPRRRSFDAMFRAFVCAGLNRGRLAQWVRLVARCPDLIDRHYERWSYVAKTGFDDILTSLEKLTPLTFYLPENLAIRHLVKSFNEFGDP